jgi:hypothetical protein
VQSPLCLVGRGMGALAVLLAARRAAPAAIALVEPWPTGGAGQLPDEPAASASRPESPLALAECRRGIDVPRPDVPVLVVGSRALAEAYGADELDASDLSSAVPAWARSASARAM